MTALTRPHFAPTDDVPEFVLDAGVTTEWLIAEADETGAGRVLNRLPFVVPVVPFTWPSQVAEWVASRLRSRRLTADRAKRFLAGFDLLRILIDAEPLDRVWLSVINLARVHRLRLAAAALLELAQRADLPLATIDPRQRSAASRAGVALFTP